MHLIIYIIMDQVKASVEQANEFDEESRVFDERPIIGIKEAKRKDRKTGKKAVTKQGRSQGWQAPPP